MVTAQRIQSLAEGDEVAGNQSGALMNQLVKAVLSVGARFAPVNGAGVVVHAGAVQRDLLAQTFHGHLLQIGREAFEILIIGQHGCGFGVQKIGVPDPQQRHENRQVLVQRSGAEVFVHFVAARQQGQVVFFADGNHGGKADGRSHGIAATHPVPETEHVVGINAEFCHFLSGCGNCYKMTGHGSFVFQSVQQPGACRLGIGHGFLRGKGFGSDDKQGFFRVQILGGFGKVSAVHVGHITQSQIALAIVPQRLVGHNRAQIGATDPDIHHIHDGFAGITLPFSIAYLCGKAGHFVQHLMHTRHHVLAVNYNTFVFGRAQRHVQYGAAFSFVDFFTGKHGVNTIAQAGFFRGLY